MAMGNIDLVLDIIYDHDVVFLNQVGEAKKGRKTY
jgi:hypothetical protein